MVAYLCFITKLPYYIGTCAGKQHMFEAERGLQSKATAMQGLKGVQGILGKVGVNPSLCFSFCGSNAGRSLKFKLCQWSWTCVVDVYWVNNGSVLAPVLQCSGLSEGSCI